MKTAPTTGLDLTGEEMRSLELNGSVVLHRHMLRGTKEGEKVNAEEWDDGTFKRRLETVIAEVEDADDVRGGVIQKVILVLEKGANPGVKERAIGESITTLQEYLDQQLEIGQEEIGLEAHLTGNWFQGAFSNMRFVNDNVLKDAELQREIEFLTKAIRGRRQVKTSKDFPRTTRREIDATRVLLRKVIEMLTKLKTVSK